MFNRVSHIPVTDILLPENMYYLINVYKLNIIYQNTVKRNAG